MIGSSVAYLSPSSFSPAPCINRSHSSNLGCVVESEGMVQAGGVREEEETPENGLSPLFRYEPPQ